MQVRSIAQAGSLQLQAILPHGDAVFVDLARLQVQTCAALVFDARCAAWHLPWQKAQAPMPLIALIGTEAPGRIEWALSTGATAQILKPVGDSGVYSALLIARNAFQARRALSAEVADLRQKIGERQTVVRAVVIAVVTLFVASALFTPQSTKPMRYPQKPGQKTSAKTKDSQFGQKQRFDDHVARGGIEK